MTNPSSSRVDVAVVQGFERMHVGSAHAAYHMFNTDQGAHAYATTCTYQVKALADSVLNTSGSGLIWSSNKIRGTINLFALPRPTEVNHDSIWTRIDDFMWDSNWRDRGAARWFKRKQAQPRFLFLLLPCKEKIGHVSSRNFAWNFLSLKSIGWGPPERNMARKIKLARKSNPRCKRIGLVYFIVLIYFLFQLVCVREGLGQV